MNFVSKKSILFLSFALFGFSQLVSAEISPPLRQQLGREVEYIGSIYRDNYAPSDWKKSFFNWNIELELSKLRLKVMTANNRFEYRDGLVQFLNSMADYHVGYAFYSTEKSSLPFSVRTIEGKTILVNVDRTLASKTTFPFEEGDELLEMNGVPVNQIIENLMKYMSTNVSTTDRALADLNLTSRSGRKNHFSVPRGQVNLKLRKASNQEIKTHQMFWNYIPETIGGLNPQDSALNPSSLGSFPSALIRGDDSISLSKLMMQSPLAMEFLEQNSPQANNHGMGSRKSFMKDFGVRIWESPKENQFDAYIFQNSQGQLIGVVRIPRYIVKDYIGAVNDFKTIIQKFESTTQGLIIDQLNNPGGSVFYLYTLVSMLNTQAVETPKHKMAINFERAMDAHKTLETIANIKTDEEAVKVLGEEYHGYPLNMQVITGLREYCNFILDAWNKGKKLSDPYFLWGVDAINPHPDVNYSKPIVILVNELDFSGGDFFPAIMQDNKRATIIGTRTSGAGGYVLEVKTQNAFGFEKITFTGSLAERVDKKPIENLGVVPDVNLPMTLADYRGGYRVYQAGVNAVLSALIKPR